MVATDTFTAKIYWSEESPASNEKSSVFIYKNKCDSSWRIFISGKHGKSITHLSVLFSQDDDRIRKVSFMGIERRVLIMFTHFKDLHEYQVVLITKVGREYKEEQYYTKEILD